MRTQVDCQAIQRNNSFFVGRIIDENEQNRNFLQNTIENHARQTIRKTSLLYRMDSLNKNNIQLKPNKTFNSTCPAIIFANSLTPNEITGITKPIISNSTKIGTSQKGNPSPINIPINFLPCLLIPISSLPNHTPIAIHIVTTNCAVTV